VGYCLRHMLVWWEQVMKPTKQWFERAALLCDEIGPEDGIDSRQLSRIFAEDKISYKSRQLCKVARQTLSLQLSGEFGDPVLQNLVIVDVTSNEDGSTLLVLFSYEDKSSSMKEVKVMDKLQRVQGSLRAAIARSVSRKRVPALRFKQVEANGEESSYAHP
jgi:ribosome-binding factor A